MKEVYPDLFIYFQIFGAELFQITNLLFFKIHFLDFTFSSDAKKFRKLWRNADRHLWEILDKLIFMSVVSLKYVIRSIVHLIAKCYHFILINICF